MTKDTNNDPKAGTTHQAKKTYAECVSEQPDIYNGNV